MGYRVDLSCADRVRYNTAVAEMGLDGDELIKTLLHDFFDRSGVKNPVRRPLVRRRTKNARKV